VSWWEPFAAAWKWYSTNRADLTPIGAFLGGALIAWAALRQAGISARRHNAQTEADRQRRITESFSKAIEQLGDEKIELRLGGIYTLERISKESETEYWTIMEIITAFVRERARWMIEDNDGKACVGGQRSGPTTDVAAALTVIVRRDNKNCGREKINSWRLNFAGSDLREAYFSRAHLEGADLGGAYLAGADLSRARLAGADLSGADLAEVDQLTLNQLTQASGDSLTTLPQELTRPEHWS
jgi:Pentapeptide repeats (8 copies)